MVKLPWVTDQKQNLDKLRQSLFLSSFFHIIALQMSPSFHWTVSKNHLPRCILDPLGPHSLAWQGNEPLKKCGQYSTARFYAAKARVI